VLPPVIIGQLLLVGGVVCLHRYRSDSRDKKQRPMCRKSPSHAMEKRGLRPLLKIVGIRSPTRPSGRQLYEFHHALDLFLAERNCTD